MAWNRPLSALLLSIVLVLLLISSGRHPQVAVAAPGDITTYAGGGVGDGGGAAGAAVSPRGMAADGAGNLYIADTLNCRVRRLTPAGAISTVAGMGICGFAGDGGPATAARLSFPNAVAVTSAGVLYIADTGNCRIRRVDAGGTITTFAGSGLCIFGGDGGAPASAHVADPRAIAVNAGGDVFIADSDNCRVRKVSAGVITTFAGTGACGSNGDGGLATAAGVTHVAGVWPDAAGNVYISDTDACRIRVVSASGTISTVAGNGVCSFTADGGTAYTTTINKPTALTTDSAGDLYIADTMNCRVRKVTYPAVTISTVAGSGTCAYSGDGGPATLAALDEPRGLALTASGLHIADTANCRIRRVSGVTITTTAGNGACQFSGDGAAATNATLSNPTDVAVDTAGNLYISDTVNCRVRRVTSSDVISTIAGTGVCAFAADGVAAASSPMDDPTGIAVDLLGNIYVAEAGACRVRKISAGIITTVAGSGTCGFSGDNGPAVAAQLNAPQGVAVRDDIVYIADTFNCRIRRVQDGVITTIAGNAACSYSGDGGPPTSASLTFPYDVAIDSAGAVYIADTQNCRVRKVNGGTISTLAGTGSCSYGGDGGPATAALLNRPTGIAAASPDAILIADTDNCRLRLVSAQTIISVAGTICGFGGDGGPAPAALLDHPSGVAVAPTGDVFVADAFNDRARRIAAGADTDGDAIADVADNCAAVSNADQTNTDRNFIDLPSPISFDDITRPNSDTAGNACDTDDDNDGLADTAEPAGCNGSGPLNPLAHDTDGDRTLDQAECLLGSNPANASSRPAPIVAPDADNDGVPDPHDPNDGASDSDGDGALDRWEFRSYNTNLVGTNIDTDTCGDAREIASVNADLVVNAIDLGLIASRFGPSTDPDYTAALDTNKDGTINSIDVGFVGSRFGFCP